eukprot:351479-Chlamydomonas_euryale.AAC.31
MAVSHRGISIVSVPEVQLHKAQNGLRRGGTPDAMFMLQSLVNTTARHQLPTKSDEVIPTLVIALVNFTQAYNRLNREALWGAVVLYHRRRRSWWLSDMTLSTFKLSVKELLVADSDKYLGSVCVNGWIDNMMADE